MSDIPRLGDILVDAHIITPEHVEAALAEQKTTGLRFGEALIRLGLVQSDDITWGLANQMGMPFVRVRADQVDPEALRLVPESIARRHTIIPYVLIDGRLTVVIDDPTRHDAIREVAEASGKDINVAVGLAEEIRRAIEESYESAGISELDPAQFKTSLFGPNETAIITAGPGASRALDRILAEAIAMRATALHFEPFADHAVLRLRIHGRLETCAEWGLPWHKAFLEGLRLKATQIETIGPHVEGLLAFRDDGRNYSFFANFIQGQHGVAATLLNVSCPDFPERVEDLGLADDVCDELLRTIGGRSGLCLVVGTEKMEKRKFIALLMDKKHAGDKRTFAIGRMPWFENERYIQIKAPTEDAEELMRSMRMVVGQDPDLIYIEDCWDRRVLTESLLAALERRFVFANLSLPSAMPGLEFILESVENRTLVAQALRGVIAVAFFRRLCPDCRTDDTDHAKVSRVLREPRAVVDRASVKRPVGCPKCRSGYADLIPLVEIVRIDQALEDLIASGATTAKIREAVRAASDRTLESMAKELVLAGELSVDDFKLVEQR